MKLSVDIGAEMPITGNMAAKPVSRLFPSQMFAANNAANDSGGQFGNDKLILLMNERGEPAKKAGPSWPGPLFRDGQAQVAEAAAIAAIEESSVASNSSSDCCALNPSASALEKLATMPF